jgi:cyclase
MLRSAMLTCLVVLSVAGFSSRSHGQALKIPEVKIEARELAPGIHVLIGGGGNVGVSAGEDGIFIIDDNLEPLTPQLIDAVGRIATGPIRFVINTHWHFDHVGGNKVLGEAGALIVAHDNVRVRMSAPQFIEALGNKVPASPAEALPVITFDQAMTLHLNGDTVQVFHVANAHTDGDAIVHFKDADVVHMGDTFFNGNYPFIDTSTGGSLDGMIASAERVLALADGNTVIIPGHGPVTDRSGLASYRELLVTVRDRVAGLIREGRSRDEVLAAKPLADLDAIYGKGFMGPERFLAIVYDDLARQR